MPEQITHRASSCPRIIECPASSAGETLINESNPIASIGTCIHDMCAEMITHDAPSMPDKSRFLEAHGVEDAADDIGFLSLMAHRLWHGYKGSDAPAIKKYFPNPIVEIKRSKTVLVKAHDAEVTLSGHMDVGTFCLPPDDDLAIVLDWKAGYKAESLRYVDQMKAYAFMQACEVKKIKRVIAIIAWLRDGYCTILEFSREELSAWGKKFFFEDIWWDGKTYNPGWACDYCPRRYSCPGRCAMLQGCAEFFGPGGGVRSADIVLGSGNILPAEQLNVAITQAKYIKGSAEKFLGLVKSSLADHGAVRVPGEEKAWSLVEKKGRQTISPALGWEVLSEVLTHDQLALVVKIGKTALKKQIGASVDKGKGKLIDETFARLEAAGAITVGKPSKELRLVDIKKEQ